jgi:hypothetical protein
MVPQNYSLLVSRHRPNNMRLLLQIKQSLSQKIEEQKIVPTLCRIHYFVLKPFVDCPECGFSSPGVVQLTHSKT